MFGPNRATLQQNGPNFGQTVFDPFFVLLNPIVIHFDSKGSISHVSSTVKRPFSVQYLVNFTFTKMIMSLNERDN